MVPKSELASFIARFDPKIAKLARSVLAAMRKRLPGANQLVYDNYNALAIGFAPAERTSDTVFSIAVFPRGVSLFFYHGVNLPDPHHLLKGTGNMVRYIRLDHASVLDEPAVQALMAVALKRADPPIAQAPRGRVIIKSVSARQRRRRPAGRPS